MARYTPIAATTFSKRIQLVIASYLEGNVEDDIIARFADDIADVLPFRQEFGSFFGDETTMRAAREVIEKMLKAGHEKNRDAQLTLLDKVLSDKVFTTVTPFIRYVEDELQKVKQIYYEELMPEIRDHMDHKRTYDAIQKIKRLIQWFPKDEELLAYQTTCKEVNPERVIYWRDPIEHLSLKPLIADPRRAFDGDVFQPAADRDLVLISELERALDVLYQKAMFWLMSEHS